MPFVNRDRSRMVAFSLSEERLKPLIRKPLGSLQLVHNAAKLHETPRYRLGPLVGYAAGALHFGFRSLTELSLLICSA